MNSFVLALALSVAGAAVWSQSWRSAVVQCPAGESGWRIDHDGLVERKIAVGRMTEQQTTTTTLKLVLPKSEDRSGVQFCAPSDWSVVIYP